MSVLSRSEKGTPLGWILRIAALTFLWAAMEAAAAGIAHHYQSAQIVGMRYGVHLVVLSVWGLRTGFETIVRTNRPVAQLSRGFCMFLVPFSFIIGASSMPLADTWAIFWVAPIIVALLASLCLRERVGAAAWTAVGIGYLAAVSILSPNRSVLASAAIWPAIAAVGFAAYLVLSRRLRDESLTASLFYTGLGAFACMFPFMVAVWQPLHVEDVASIAGIGVAGLLFLLWLDESLEGLPASVLAPFLYGVLLWEEGIYVLWFHSFPSAIAIGGSAVLLGLVGVGGMLLWNGSVRGHAASRDHAGVE